MSPFWWFVLAAILVLSPMSMLKPSPRQKRLVMLREKARHLGIRVTLISQQLDPGLKLEGAAYRWLRPADAPAMPGYLCLLRCDERPQRGVLWSDGWEMVRGAPELLTEAQQQLLDRFLTLLPADAHAVEWGSATLSFWWHERGDTELLEVLHPVAQAMLAEPVRPVPRADLAGRLAKGG